MLAATFDHSADNTDKKFRDLNSQPGAQRSYSLADFKSCPSLLTNSPVRLKGRSEPSGVTRGSTQKYVSGLPAYLSVRDDLGRNALIYAVLGNSVKCLKSLLKAGVNVNEVDVSGRSALHWAVIKNLVDCTRVMLSSGAKFDLQDNEGATPLHLATKHENSKCLQLILKHLGPAPDTILDNDKRTALHWSACCAHVDNFDLLLKHCNQMITMRDVAGMTALHWAACSPRMAAVDCIRLFFAQEVGAGVVNVSDYEGRTALHCAVIDGILPVVMELILLPSCNVDVKDNLESTPLHWATILGKCEIVNLLLDHGASVAVHDIDGATPWHYAVQNDSLEMLSAYTSRFAIPDQRDQNGCTPLMWAASKAANKAITMLCRFGADLHARDNQDYTALHVAAFSGHSSTLDTLLDLGVLARDVDAQGKTALFLACEMGHLDAARTLLRRGGSDVNHVVDRCGRTCLHWAASNGHINTCQLLIENGYDPNAADFAGRTPVLYATFHGYIDCMSVLKENGGDPKYCDNEGWTALHYACKQGHFDAVKLLLDWNVNPNPKAHSGERFTPLDLATINVHLDVSKFLYKKGGVSITHIRQMAAIIIQDNSKVENQLSTEEKVAIQEGKRKDETERTNLHRRVEKRLSRSVENLPRDFTDEPTGQFLSSAYCPLATGPLRLRRKKFQNPARSELALKCSSAEPLAMPTGRRRIKSAGAKSRHHLVEPKASESEVLPLDDTLNGNTAHEKRNKSPMFGQFDDAKNGSSVPVPAWCFDPVLRKAAEKNWLDTLANMAFKRVPMKCEIHISGEEAITLSLR